MGFSYVNSYTVAASSTYKIMLARQAGFPVWADLPGSTYGMLATWVTGGSDLVNTTYFFNDPPTRRYANGVASTAQVGLSGLTAWPWYIGSNPFPLVGVDSSNSRLPSLGWEYAPAGAPAYIVVSSATPVTADTIINLYFEAWTAPGESFLLTVAVTIPTTKCSGIASIAAGTWYRIQRVSYPASFNGATQFQFGLFWSSGTFTWTDSINTRGTFAVTGSGSGTAFLPLTTPTEFSNSALPWFSTRTTAAAMLCTNVTQVLNKGGTALGGRISPNVYNPFNTMQSVVAALHPAEKAFLALETGAYTYVPPSTDMVNFWDYTMPVTAGAATFPIYRLDNDSLVNLLFLSTTATAEIFALTTDVHVEFRTSSTLFDIGLSAVTLETLHQAQLVLAQAGFFFENPTHSKVLSQITQAAKRYGPAVIGSINPLAGRVLKTAITLSRKPKASPKPTSAGSAGMLGKPKGKKEKGKAPKVKRKG